MHTADQALPRHIRGLLAPGMLVPAGVDVSLVQTHISYVLLAGDRAYKLKKPRDLGFLDYTTLARRRAACEAEVTLNRRLTSGVYLGVMPVTRTRTGYQIGGEGRPVDYAVAMRRLPAERMMDHLVERDAVPPELLTRLARHLAAFYGTAATGGHIDESAAAAMLLTNWQENFLQTLPYAGNTLTARAYAGIAGAIYRNLLRLRTVWQERIAAGRARDCHGDLRLSSVCFEDAIQVYDCIEFNERFRHGDVAADIAFLTMDLDGHGRPDLADEFLAAFVEASGDTTLPAVLPFYRCYRAFVRGKVDSFQLDEPEVPVVQRQAARAAARRRFALAVSYIRPPRTSLALVVGRSARTRDAVAAALAGRLGAVLVDAEAEGASGEAGRRLARGIPVVLRAAVSERELWAHACLLGERYRTRPQLVTCGPIDAMPEEGIALGEGEPRAVLRELHTRLSGSVERGARNRQEHRTHSALRVGLSL